MKFINCLVKIFNCRNWLIIFLVTSFFGYHQIFAQTFSFKNISIQNGLPQSQAYDIVFDNFNQAWIATQGGGICRYDGSNFLYFTKSDSLLSNRVYSVYFHNESIFIGQKSGITIFDSDGNFQGNLKFENSNLVVNEMIYFDSTLFVASDKGLFYVKQKSLVQYNENINLNDVLISSFLVDNNQLWCCTSEGLIHLANPFYKINKARGLPVNQVECAVKIQDEILIGTYGAGIQIYKDKNGFYCPEELRFLSEDIITAFYKSSEEQIWIGTLNSGLISWNRFSKTVIQYTVKNGLANNNIKSITKDNWGNIWVGTNGGGLSIFQNSPFVKYTTDNGLNGNYIYAVLVDKSNNLWVATDGGGVTRINDTSSVIFDEELGFVSDKVRFIFEDNYGNIWLASESSGVGLFYQNLNKDTVVLFNQSNSTLSTGWIKNLIPGKGNEFYMATLNGGIYQVKSSAEIAIAPSFKKVKIKSGNLPPRLTYIFNYQNTIWFVGDDNTYGFIQNENVTTFESNSVNFRNAVTDKRKVWIGSTDNGILQFEYRNDTMVEENWINTEKGLASNNIYQIIIDNNILWVGTEKGIDKVYLSDKYEVDSIFHFGIEEGFDGIETNNNAIFKDKNGIIWFGTVNGLFALTGNEINAENKKPPYLRITDVKIFYESISQTIYASHFKNGQIIKPLQFPHNENHIGFSFKAIQYSKQKSIKYSWKLLGVDRDWTPFSSATEATYGNLLPGDYTFSVVARIDNELSVEQKISFKIIPPYYQQTWFKVLYISASLLILLIFFFIVWYRIRKRNKRLQEKFQLEKNLIELEQKALRLQMNPHFIFNVLNSIHNLIILKDSDKARYALAKFSKLMRQVLENSREKLISIDDELACVENYIQLERLTSNLDINLIVKIDEQIDTAENLIPPLLIQPFVENAIIHGLKKIDRSGLIRIEFNLIKENLIECKITDNGVGRQNAHENNFQKTAEHKSTALKVTQERLALLKATDDFQPITLIDLKDTDGNPIGTCVVLKIYID